MGAGGWGGQGPRSPQAADLAVTRYLQPACQWAPPPLSTPRGRVAHALGAHVINSPVLVTRSSRRRGGASALVTPIPRAGGRRRGGDVLTMTRIACWRGREMGREPWLSRSPCLQALSSYWVPPPGYPPLQSTPPSCVPSPIVSRLQLSEPPSLSPLPSSSLPYTLFPRHEVPTLNPLLWFSILLWTPSPTLSLTLLLLSPHDEQTVMSSPWVFWRGLGPCC